MPFKVAARTILELGSELISSDAIALYELIKNAIDAKSDSGVEIGFNITLSLNNYRVLLTEFESDDESDIDQWRGKIINALESDAFDEHVDDVRDQLESSDDWEDIEEVIHYAYRELSYIEISDTGSGMSLKDLKAAFLTIGTPSRYRVLEAALENDESGQAPVLGEKGVGRLSAMRLGDILEVTTTTQDGAYYNELLIDWREFGADSASMIEDIEVEPQRGERKTVTAEHGTVLRIRHLTSSWSQTKLAELADRQLARITDPFSAVGRRFGIHLRFNGKKINFTRFIRKILFGEAHAIVKGRFVIDKSGEPSLTLKISAPFFGRSEDTERYGSIDLLSLTAARLGDVSPDTLSALGAFEFDLYWFNRKRVKKPAQFETRRQFLDLIQAWSGIMVYRDGYQVLPYGDEDTDWLELDRRALASKGYKLNKSQFVGRVSISRLDNPQLIDQTNREGLRGCNEKTALVLMLRFAIQDRLRILLEECQKEEKRSKDVTDDPRTRKREVVALSKRARSTINQVEPKRSEDRILLKQVFEMFGELETRYKATERRLVEAKGEQERLVDLAGIGLIIETLAHELTRTVEHAADVLNQQKKRGLPPEVRDFFSVLKISMDAIEKRLKILDPLSISGRQRRRSLDLRRIVEVVIESHALQFERHDIAIRIKPAKSASVSVFAVEGRLIQILENLISNSVYWIKAQKLLNKNAPRWIEIELMPGNPAGFRFSDSGPGIPPERSDKVFTPFYSTKPEKTRQGLGLYIARECAGFHKGTIELDEDDLNERGNLHTFIVEIPDTRVKAQ